MVSIRNLLGVEAQCIRTVGDKRPNDSVSFGGCQAQSWRCRWREVVFWPPPSRAVWTGEARGLAHNGAARTLALGSQRRSAAICSDMSKDCETAKLRCRF